MARATTLNRFENFLRNIAYADDIGKYFNQRNDPESPSDVIEEADQELKDRGYNHAVEMGFDLHGLSRSDLDNVADPQYEHNLEYILNQAKDSGTLSHKDASRLMKENLDGFVDRDVPNLALEEILKNQGAVKIIGSYASEDEKKVIDLYGLYQNIKGLTERYERSGKVESEEQGELIRSAVIEGAKKTQIESYRRMGYDIVDQEMAGKLAVLGARNGYTPENKVKEYAMRGLREQVAKSKEAYDEASNSSGKDVIDATRGAIKNLAGTNFKIAKRVIYGAGVGKLDEELAKLGAR